MIDRLQRIAQSIQFLRLPSIAVGLISLASMVVIILTSKSHEGDRFLIPSVVGLLWAMTTYAFLVTFRSVPEKASKTWRLVSRLKRNISRGWYWFISAVFVGTTVGAIFITIRMASIWLRDYSN